MTKNNSDNKKIVFYDSAKKHADLKIRWKYDGLKQSEFFRLLSSVYLAQDERIVAIISEYKKANKVYNKQKRNRSERMYQRAKETKVNFSLEDSEVESIFDILEKEHPDL
tara:strand:+ start:168 stop:497 length:330 start_codon:yes stop_codon:yes gene_type:complete